ncbi:MAG: ribonuclease R [Paludibacteraceae bacterium]|nr:ribonuclease R [Paludibacteraceae bacterium]
MRTKDLIAKRLRREKAQIRKQQNKKIESQKELNTKKEQEYVLPEGFSEEVKKEVRKLPRHDIPQAEIMRRRDMRDVLTFTIDPDEAKDFDDALSFQELESGNCQIGIHIADVTHYVAEQTALDDEAYHRGTSIYLVDKVIPMLPERLSNELCSLRPKEDKLCMSVILEMDNEAKVIRHKICRTIICSDYRLTYRQAQDILEEKTCDAIRGNELKVSQAIRNLNQLAQILRANRFRHGAINFEAPEAHFRLDEQGEPVEIFFHKSYDSNHLIDEFMLLANRIVAAEIGKKNKNQDGETTGKYPFVFRVHANPDPEKLSKLATFIKRFGFSLKTSSNGGATHKQINALLDNCQGHPSQTLVETLTIRSMAKAVYSTSNIGHYGLAFPYYTHFTSPIRRYPDMMVHRLVAKYLLQSKALCRSDIDELEQACVHSTDCEMAAQAAERDSIKQMHARWISRHLGEEFDAVVSGVTEFGLFVQLNDTLTEGLVPIRTIEPHDYMQYDEDNYCLIAARSGKTYTLSDPVRVKVTKVDIERKLIDFVLVEEE